MTIYAKGVDRKNIGIVLKNKGVMRITDADTLTRVLNKNFPPSNYGLRKYLVEHNIDMSISEYGTYNLFSYGESAPKLEYKSIW